jgi:hypothetical protein
LVHNFSDNRYFDNSFILFLRHKYSKGACTTMMRKGVTGKIMTFIISLVIGIIALALLWFFLTEGTDIITQGIQKALMGIRCKLFCRNFLGMDLGMCKGC